ncbi:MAG: amino acid permease, partial [Mycobacterium sp.]
MNVGEAPVTGDVKDDKVSLPTLTAMVIGSMIGSGVFLLPRRFGVETGVAGALIAWTIAGAGMLMLAFVFQRLATRKPDLDAGIYAYARAGFGDYVGFNSAFGFWASACAGNTSYWVLIMVTLGSLFPALFPALGDGSTVIAVVVSSIGVWLFFYLILRGVKEAAIINRIATFAKIVPILMFIVIAVIAFKADVFTGNFWGGDGNYSWASLFEQAKGTMLITVFVFMGIEGASVYSRFAKKREDVGKATVIGFLAVLSVFMLVTLSSYGVMPQSELAGATQPSMAAVLESVVGPWGS